MEITFLNSLIIFLIGIFVGFVNTLAGSGSLITLPLLIFLGMDASIANGTNRIAILLQTLVGLIGFKKEKILETKSALKLSIPIIIGAIPGAYLASQLPSLYLEKVLGVIFFIMPLIIILKPKNWNKNYIPDTVTIIKPIHYFLFLLIGFYGGFIQAGVGIFIIFALVMGPGFDLIKSNALKLFLTFIFTPLAIFIFYTNNQVDWIVGVILGLGAMIGAYIGVKTAIKTGVKYIKWLIVIMVIFSAFYFVIK
jgi:uncharacterized membrane protein YfcA